MAEPLLTKDAINIGGHKFPIALVGGIAALIGVIVVLRARKSGGQVAVGAPNTGVNPAVDFTGGSTSPDFSGALTNLSQQLTNLQQGINAPAGALQPQTTLTSAGGPVPLGTVSGGAVNLAGWAPSGAPVKVTGSPVFTHGLTDPQNLYTEVPVDIGGLQSFVNIGNLQNYPHI